MKSAWITKQSVWHDKENQERDCGKRLLDLTTEPDAKGSDTLESFLSKDTFGSNLRKKLARIGHVLIVKVSFERRKMAKVSFHDTRARFLSKVTF